MKTYRLEAIEKAIQKYINNGGEVKTIKEGVLGYGTTVVTCPLFRTLVIQEVYLNAWSSVHTVRQYKRTPKKYLQ